MAKARTILRETFHQGTCIYQGEHPRLPYLRADLSVQRVDVLTRGIVERDDQVQEYIDVRLWMMPKKA